MTLLRKSFLPIALSAVLSFAVPHSQAAEPAKSEPSAQLARDLLNRYVSMKNARDPSKIAEIYPENYIENSGRNPSGLAALTQNWTSQFAAIPDLQIIVHDVIVSGDKLVARLTYTGTHTTPFFASIPPTGRKMSLGTIDIWRVENGKLAEHWDQVDYAGLQRQLTAKQ
jgi:predicted ester cyclase